MVAMIKMKTCIQILSLACCILQETLVSTACTGSGFPVEWTIADAGVTYWYVTRIIKRQFTAKYNVTDYLTTTGLAIGASPSCLDEYFDSTTGYYYYLMYYSDDSIYSHEGVDICHGYKQFDNVIREFYYKFDTSGTITSAVDCVGQLTTVPSSLALSKYNFQYANCPFEFTTYNFTFSDSGNPNYCAGKISNADIKNESINLQSCYDPSKVTSASPYYGPFSCLSSWHAEERDTISFGDFIVIEMFDEEKWPYCGRYKVDENGAITISVYLSMSRSDWSPVYCLSTYDNEFMYDDGSHKIVRMIFTLPSSPKEEDTTQVEPTTAITKPTTTSLNLMTLSTKQTTDKPSSSTIESTLIELKTVTSENRTEGVTTGQQKATTILTNGSTKISHTKEEDTTQVEPTTAITKPTTTSLNLMTLSTKQTTDKPSSSTIESTLIELKTVTSEYRTEGVTTGQQKATIILTNGSTKISHNTVTLKSSGFPYWWIIVGVLFPLIALLTCSLTYAAKNRKGKCKVDIHNQEEGTSAR